MSAEQRFVVTSPLWPEPIEVEVSKADPLVEWLLAIPLKDLAEVAALYAATRATVYKLETYRTIVDNLEEAAKDNPSLFSSQPDAAATLRVWRNPISFEQAVINRINQRAQETKP